GRSIEYSKPLSAMRSYVEQMAEARYLAFPPPADVPIVLAALGPKMLELAGTQTAGAHTYNVTPEHTAEARKIVGPDAMLCVEQKVLLGTDATQARETAGRVLKFYQRAPGYRANWNRLGFSDDDLDQLSAR